MSLQPACLLSSPLYTIVSFVAAKPAAPLNTLGFQKQPGATSSHGRLALEPGWEAGTDHPSPLLA